MKRTQFIAVDAFGETFRKRHYDEQLDWHEQTSSRQNVREELMNRLSRPSSLTTNRSHGAPVDERDTFTLRLDFDFRPTEIVSIRLEIVVHDLAEVILIRRDGQRVTHIIRKRNVRAVSIDRDDGLAPDR